MGRKRTKDKHLPPCVYFHDNAYYYVKYVNKKKKWHFLHSNFTDAMKIYWERFIDVDHDIYTMDQLFDRYMYEVASIKALSTYKGNIQQMVHLRTYFGAMSPQTVKAIHIYKYLDIRGNKTPIAANREKALLSHCFSYAIRWGIIEVNPCTHVKGLPEKPRNRYIEDWEFIAVKEYAKQQARYKNEAIIQQVMEFAYLTGQRIGDILKLKLEDLTEEGIKIEQQKTKVKIIIGWSKELRECIDSRLESRRFKKSNFVFCNRDGEKYSSTGFSTLWQRLIKSAVDNGIIKEPFTFHDIRAKASSDLKDRMHATALLGHFDPKTTERHYNRTYKKVEPGGSIKGNSREKME